MSTVEQFDGAESEPGDRAGLILFVLGAARIPPEPPLPAAALIALLEDLGLSEGAARSAILRMRRGDWLVSHRAGRSVAYAPSDRLLAGHRRRAGTFNASTAEWNGSFHALLVSVPERLRAFRDEFRRAANIAGYRTLRAGLLVAPSDRADEFGDLLDNAPSQASVISGWLQLDADDTRRVATELWGLDELAERYRSLTGAAQSAASGARRGRKRGADALRAFVEAALPIYQAVAEDPGLPPELLPAGWPASALGVALEGAIRAFGPAVTKHITELRTQATIGSQ